MKLFFILSFSIAILFEADAQTFRGNLKNADNGGAIGGAALTLRGANGVVFQAKSDENGEFLMESVSTGWYDCQVEVTGFEPLTLKEIYVASGKEEWLEIVLHPLANALPEVSIMANQAGRRSLQPIGEIALTRDQTVRFPAMAFDPGRLAAAYAGVVQQDDGANGISIRGNSPSTVGWRLEGTDILNPNHLSNAGTFSDQPAGASGGVLMFSGQLLDNASLLTGSLPVGYSNAGGGVMDMNLRAGNDQTHEFTTHVSLIGLDVAAEGPLNRAKQSSYIANYRYSTVGLLGQMGVSFGNEQINFQDFAFKLRFPTAHRGTFSVFGMGGLSENIYKHTDSVQNITDFKNFLDIQFRSKTAIIGASHLLSLRSKGWLKTTVTSSWQKNDYLTYSYNALFPQNTVSNTEETKVSWHTQLSQRIGNRQKITAGLLINVHQFDGQSTHGGWYYLYATGRRVSIQPWANWHLEHRNGRTTAQLGLHSNITSPYATLEPRLVGSHRLSQQDKISLSAGLQTMTQPIWMGVGSFALNLTPNEPTPTLLISPTNRNLSPTKIWQISTQYSHTFKSGSVVQWAFFYQDLRSVPTYITDKASAFSLLNGVEQMFSNYPLGENGKGRNYGAEIQYQRYFGQGWFMLANATLLRSEFGNRGGDWQRSKWDVGQVLNLTTGREWAKVKPSNKIRTLGFSLRTVYSGGLRDLSNTPFRNPFNPDIRPYLEATYSQKLPDYFRADLRLYWKRNLGNKRNSILALDLQNVSNQQNVAYYYYDNFRNSTQTKYQLGLIPNLGWKLEF